MKNNEFDSLFSQSLDAYESSVSSDMFDRIMKERRRKGGWRWFQNRGWMLMATLAALLMTGLGYEYLRTPPRESEVQSPKFEVQSPESEVQSPKGTIAMMDNAGPQSTVHSPQSKDAAVPADVKIKSIVKNEGHVSLVRPDVSEDTTSSPTLSILGKTIAAENGLWTSDSGLRTSNSGLRTSDSGFRTSDSGLQTSDSRLRTASLLSPLAYRTSYIFISPISNLKAKALILKGPGTDCPSFTTRNKLGNEGWYFDLYGSPEMALRDLKEKSAEMSPYAKARDSIERPWYAFSVGMRASYVFNNGLALRGGLYYAQNNEIFNYSNPAETRIITTIDSTFDPKGVFTGTTTVQKTVLGIHTKTTYNRYRSLDLPIQIGYEWTKDEVNTWSVNAGVNVNLLTWRKADILGPDLMPLSITAFFDQKNVTYKSNVGLSLFASFAWYHQLGENSQLMLEPQIRYGLGSITNDDYPLSLRYTTVGLIAGIRWKL